LGLDGFGQKVRKLFQQIRVVPKQFRHLFQHAFDGLFVFLVVVENVQKTSVLGTVAFETRLDLGDVRDGVLEPKRGGPATVVGVLWNLRIRGLHQVGLFFVLFGFGQFGLFLTQVHWFVGILLFFLVLVVRCSRVEKTGVGEDGQEQQQQEKSALGNI
jgi:hypothetical protein